MADFGSALGIVRHWLAQFTLWIGAALVLFVFLLVLYGVGTRYLAGASPIWFDELARYAIIASAMIGVGGVWVEGAHMRVGVLEARVPPRWARTVVTYQWLLTLALAAMMTWYGWTYMQSVSFFTTQGLQISRSWPVMFVPIGFALLFVLALLKGPAPLPQPHEETGE